MKKFIADPAVITLLGSVNIAFGVLVAPWIAWRSDTSWTRIGRRKPYMLVGLLVLAACLVAMPLATGIWMLVPIILIYQFSMDVGYTGPWKPLYMDVVPDAQRGRGMVINRYISFAARLAFMYFLIGKFDEKVGFGKLAGRLAKKAAFHLTGEQLIYFIGAGLVLLTAAFLAICVREEPPAHVDMNRRRPMLKGFLRDLFGSRQRRLLCLPIIAAVLMRARLFSLQPLLITEQFGYSKQAMGNMHSVSMLINAALILPLMALIVDRTSRLRIFLVCVIASTLQPIAFWTYVKFFAPGQVPSPATFVGFHVADAAFDHAAQLALWPMVFQATNAGDRGRTSAAFLVVAGIVTFVSTNLMGLFVKAVSAATCPAGTYDYLSGYLYIFLVGLVAVGLAILYARRRI